jgi:hypothetical protein
MKQEIIYFYRIKYRKMKYLFIAALLLAFSIKSKCQNSSKIYDPCQQLDTNKIRDMLTGTWVDTRDTSHVLTITDDSLTEKIVIMEGTSKKTNVSYFSYKFTDNIFSSDAVTCYSIVEYIPGYPTHTDFAINSITEDYLLLGSTGKMAFKRKN